MRGQQLGWELGHCSAVVIFPLWASIPSSAMEITALAHTSGASEDGFVKVYDTAWGWKDFRMKGSQLRLSTDLLCLCYPSSLFANCT